MNLDQDIRTMLHARAEGVAAAPVIPHSTLRRVRVRKTLMTGSVAAVVAALVFGGFGASRSLSNDAAPISPADETENKDPRAVTFSFPDVEVSMHAAEPWAAHFVPVEPLRRSNSAWGGGPALVLDGNFDEHFGLEADPLPVGTGCQGSLAFRTFDSGDAEAMAREIRSDSDLESTAPVAVSMGGVDALRMDVTGVSGASPCSKWGPGYPPAPMVLHGQSRGAALEEGSRMRLYLLDTPWRGENWSRRVFALWIVAPETRFEHVAEAAQPILDSLDFHAP